MQKSETIGELAKALSKAQGLMRPAVKDSTNPHFRSRYADLSSIWDACREPLTANGLSVIQLPEEAQEGRIRLTTILLHESGEWISGQGSTKLIKDDPQGVGSALTYLRRYGLAAMLGIVADEDDDGNAASTAPKQAPQKASTNGNGASYHPVPTPAEGAWRPRFESMLLDLYTEEVKLAIEIANDLNCEESLFLAQQKRDKDAHNLRTMSREAALALYEATQHRVEELRAKLARPGQEESSPKAPRAAA